MTSKLVRAVSIALVAGAVGCPVSGEAQAQAATWLNESKPASWNEPGLSIPAAPAIQADVNPGCREMARPPELEEDRALRDRGWLLDGAYQGGWGILVIRATAGYDGMCRPWQYQVFVFARGDFAGTLSPVSMNSRTDGALTQVFLASNGRLTAEYLRYAASDPACCPSRTTSVEFEIPPGGRVRPLSATTSSNR